MSEDFRIFQKRLANRGTTMTDRMTRDKLDSFLAALGRSYNSEEITKDGVKYRALISDNKVKMDTDEKTVSVVNEANFKIGDMFYWDDTDTHWLIHAEHLAERAYFRGEIRKALYKIKWRNDNGIVYEQWTCVRGPVETKIKEESKKSLIFDVPNNTLVLLMSATEGTGHLKRYGKIMLDGRTWEIASVDDITAPGIAEIQLTEDYYDSYSDDSENSIAGGKEPIVFTVTSSLDNISEVTVGSPLNLIFDILRNDIRIANIEDIVITTNSETDVITSDTLTLNTPGTATVNVSIASIGYSKTYTFTVVDTISADVITYAIEGSERVKCFGEQAYTVKKYINGQVAPNDGSWSLATTTAATIKSQTTDSIILAMTGQMGTITLTYSANLLNTDKTIKVVSMFG